MKTGQRTQLLPSGIRFCCVLFTTLTAVAFFSSGVYGATRQWNRTSGSDNGALTNWDSTAGWIGGVIPVYADTALFEFADGGSPGRVITNALGSTDFVINSLRFHEGRNNMRYLTDLSGRRLTIWGSLVVGSNTAGSAVGNNLAIVFTNGTLEVGTPTNKASWFVGTSNPDLEGTRPVTNVIAASLIATNISSLVIGNGLGATETIRATLDLSGANVVGRSIAADNVTIGSGTGGFGTLTLGSNTSLTNLTVNHNWQMGVGGTGTFGTFIATNLAVKIGSASATATNLFVGLHTSGGAGIASGLLVITNSTVEGYLRVLAVGTNASTTAGTVARGTLDFRNSPFIGGGLNISNMVVGGGLNATGTVFFGSGAARTTNLIIATGSRVDLNSTVFGVGSYLDLATNTAQGTISGSGLFANLGTIGAAGGPGFGSGIAVSNVAGSVIQATNRTLSLAGGLINHGLLNIASQATNVIGSAAGGVFTNNGTVRLLNSGTQTIRASVLIVSNGFVSSAGSTITNDGGTAILRFTAESPVVNNGALRMQMTASTGTELETFRLTIGSSSNLFLVNNGELVFGYLDAANNNAAGFFISNQFVNAGTFVITNAAGDPDEDARADVRFTGTTRTTGGASTNTGTIRLVSTASSPTAPAAGSLTFANGDFVNAGTITVKHLNPLTAGVPTTFRLAEAGAVFSNAVGGQVIMEAGGTGTFAIRSAVAVNLGTNIVNAGTLIYQTGTGAANVFTNKGLVALSGGHLEAGNGIVNSGQIRAAGGVNSLTGGLLNQSGGVFTTDAARVTVNGIFTNAGTVAMMNSVGTFNNAVVNSGAWITDPTTNVFTSDFTVTPSGYIQMAAGDVYIFTNNGTAASFLNQSTESNLFDTIDGKFVFNATLTTSTQHFQVAGSNIGNLDIDGGFNTVTVPTLNVGLLAQYSNNFALGTLRVDSFFDVFTELSLDQGGLFLTNLELGATGHLTISNDVQVYFITSNAFTAAQVTLLGNGGLHQLVLAATEVVPEPSTLLLITCGGLTAWFWLRRNSSHAAR